MLKVKLLRPVTYSGAIVEAGEEIILSEKSANSLVADKVAVAVVNQEPATVGVTGEPGGEGTNGTPGEADALKDEIDGQEELAKVIKALDDKYNRDPLAAAAKDLGVEFAYDAKKAEIIEAVIAADKAEVMLQV